MRADNSRHLAKAARSRAEQTRRRAVSTLRHLATTEQTITVSVLAQRRGIPILAVHPGRPARPDPRGTPTADDSPCRARPAGRQRQLLRQRLQLAHQRIGELEADNQQLRHALAQALGDQRARHARDPLENRP